MWGCRGFAPFLGYVDFGGHRYRVLVIREMELIEVEGYL